MSVTKPRSPRVRLTESSLNRVGVTLIDEDQPWFQCQYCGGTWTYRLLPGGRLPRRWWWCAHHECNAPEEFRR